MTGRAPVSRGRARCAVLLVFLALPTTPAAAQTAAPTGTTSSAPGLRAGLPTAAVAPGGLVTPSRSDVPPPGRRLTADRVGRIADALAAVRGERHRHPRSTREVYVKGPANWQVSYFARVPPGKPRKEIAQVHVRDRDRRVLETWTDYKVAWTMARGYPGAFGRIVNAPWVWIPLALLFVLPFVDPRRPLRTLHLDLLVLSAFSVSLAFFNASRIDISVPLVTPLLAYLVARMLWIGLRRRDAVQQARQPLHLLVPLRWLAIAVIFLVGFRVALNVTRSNVIDVGYAGVIGADRFGDGRQLYDAFPSENAYGDTYGPAIYAAYVPFEQALTWSGSWDELPAAHGAAIAFDLLACLLCFLVGRRVRGPTLGIALAYGWVTFPFTLYVSMSNANDALVTVLLLAALLAVARPARRGALLALAGLTKFAPLALAPLFAMHPRPRVRSAALFAAGFALAAVLAFVPVVAHNDLRDFWDATVGFQAQRGSPFSPWGLYDPDVSWLDSAQRVVQVAALLLALVLAFVPRRRDIVGLAALSAAILLALQLGVSHWFYLYIPWFFPLVMLALLGRWGEPARA